MTEDKPHSMLFGSISQALLSAGIGFRFQARGRSMQPAIQDGEILHVQSVVTRELKKGDIVLFADDAHYKAHRLIFADHAADVFMTKGDAGTEMDVMLRGTEIVGRVVAKEKGTGRRTQMIPLCGRRARLRGSLAQASNLVSHAMVSVLGQKHAARLRNLIPAKILTASVWYFLFLSLLLSSSAMHAQVAVDASTSLGQEVRTTAATMTFSHTTAVLGLNRLLVVGVSMDTTNNTALTVSGITYGGTALTVWGKLSDGTKAERVEMWYLIAPATGVNSVVVSFSGVTGTAAGVVAGATTFTGADQTAPLRPFVSASDSGTTASLSTLNVPSGVNEMVMDTLSINGSRTATLGTTQIQAWAKNSGGTTSNTDAYGVASTRSGAPSVPLSESFSGTSLWSMGAVSIRASQGDLAVSVVGSSALYPANFTYTVTVTNNGPSASTATVTDTLPGGLALVSATATPGTCSGTAPITCALGSLAANATATIVLTVSPGATGGYPDTAAVTGTIADLNNGNNSATGVGFSQAFTCTTPTNAAGGTLTGVINTYYPGMASASTGATQLTVGPATGSTAIAAGDVLLVMQMQNANIDSTNTSSYGDGATGSGTTSLNNSGVYEFATAAGPLGLGGGTVLVSGAGPGGGLLYSYTTSAANATQGQFTYQVIRVPHYGTATLGAGLTASPWNGSTGGVVALDLEGMLTLGNGKVTVDGLGFRGGAGLQLQGGTGASTDYRLASPATYAGVAEAGAQGSKGEGIAGTPLWVSTATGFLSTTVDGYPNGSMARGAPGNAGGGGTDADPQTASPGGNDKNAGGGGGGNGGNGGSGGNAWSANLSSGGLGGTAFPAAITRVALGGGGGAGSRNNDNGVALASSAAAGGGIVILRVGTLSGSGTISANGAAAYNGTANDAAGGGGAGGSIIILSAGGGESGLTISAQGGSGGNAWATDPATGSPLADRHGPGGGGGGGVALLSGAAASINVAGGANGTTLQAAYPYGATGGAPGVSATNVTLGSSPGPNSAATPCTDVSITKTGTPNPVDEGQTLTYTLVVTNNGPSAASGVVVTDPLPTTDVTYVSSSTTLGGPCMFAGVTVTCPIGAMPVGASATITIVTTATTLSLAVNSASVTESQADDLLANNFATQSETIETPTGVKLESFMAGASSGGALLSWKTGGETRNLGFNLYREVNGQRVRVNSSLIAGSALIMRHTMEQHTAKTYSWIDRTAGANLGLYWLEDVDLNGTRTFHGPISVQGNSVSPSAVQSLMIPELNSTDAVPENSATSEVMEAVASVSTSTPQQQQTQFQLASQPAVKVFVRREGWYKITQPQLVAAGISPFVDPSRLRLFAEGIEQPIRIVGAGPGSGGFGPQALVEFYGTGIDTFYSDKRVYWLVAGNRPGLRIPQQGYESGGPQPQSFLQTILLNQRTTYFAALLKENTDNFFGALVSPTSVDQVLTATNIAPTAMSDVSLRVVLQGVTEQQPHDVTIVMNGSTLGELNFNGQNEGSITLHVPAGVLRQGANTVTLTAQNGENDLSVVDYITLTYPHSFTAESDSLKFTVAAGDHVVVNGFRQTPTLLVDITNPAQPIEVAMQVLAEKGKFFLQAKVPWSTSGMHTLLALSDRRITAPFGLMRNNPSNLHSAQPGSEVVMISYPEFETRLGPLTQLHRAEGKTVAVINVNDIYDEFNFGERSPYALRSFLQTATAHWKNSPKYLLLTGDATFDPRNYLGLGSFDFVPTKIIVTSELKTASDDWFSDFNNTGFAQIATGRLPVRTQDDASTVVGKITGYATSQSGGWTNQALMVADRDDSINFTKQSQSVQNLLPKSMNVRDIYAGNMDAAAARHKLFRISIAAICWSTTPDTARWKFGRVTICSMMLRLPL